MFHYYRKMRFRLGDEQARMKMKNFEFAFDDKDLSDRVLHIQIVADSLASDSEPDTEPKTKRLKKAIGDFAHEDNSNTVVKVTTLHINSAILAVDSPFFLKLFKNGMRESIEKHVTLRINASEEVALMDLLSFMYKNTLSATSVPDLLDVMVIADKFEVTSCIRYCGELLEAEPLSLESAVRFLSHPSMGDENLLRLQNKAKDFLVYTFDEFVYSNYRTEELMDLPLSALEVVLDIDGLQVESEQDVYDLILKWARKNYPNMEERREILTKRLARFIYFPYLCKSTLKEIQVCPDFDSKEISNLVFESLYLNSGFDVEEKPLGFGCGQPRIGLSGDTSAASMLRRYYRSFPVKAFEFESPKPHCVVYFCLSVEDCEYITSDRRTFSSQCFPLGEEWFILYVSYALVDAVDHLCLSTRLHRSPKTGPMDVEFAFMIDPDSLNEFPYSSNEFRIIDDKKMGDNGNLESRITSTTLMAKDNIYFIDNMLHLRAKISRKDPETLISSVE